MREKKTKTIFSSRAGRCGEKEVESVESIDLCCAINFNLRTRRGGEYKRIRMIRKMCDDLMIKNHQSYNADCHFKYN